MTEMQKEMQKLISKDELIKLLMQGFKRDAGKAA